MSSSPPSKFAVVPTSPASPTAPGSALPSPIYERYHRPGSSGRFRPRRASTASSVTSIGGSLDIAAHNRGNTLRESTQNAISTLLTPPIVRTGLVSSSSAASGSRRPTPRDIPPVTLTNISRADEAIFTSYLSKAGSLYDAFQRAKAAGQDGSSELFRKEKDLAREGDTSDTLDSILRGAPSRHAPSSRRPSILSSRGSVASLTSMESLQTQRRPSTPNVKRNTQPTPLSTIPPVYFSEEFRLENPRIFDVVSERSEIVPPTERGMKMDTEANGELQRPPLRKTLAANVILQEKLSWYMDTVELHLIASISAASTSFFAALGSLKDLQSEAGESTLKIQKIRTDLARLDTDVAVTGSGIVRIRRKRENLRKFGNATAQLQRVVEGMTDCEDLADGGRHEAALDRLHRLKLLISGEADVPLSGAHSTETQRQAELLDLRHLKALEGIPDSIDLLLSRIGRGVEAKFLNMLVSDLRRHLQQVSQEDTLRRWADATQRSRGDNARLQSTFPSYAALDAHFYSELLSFLKLLNRANYTAPAISAFRDAIIREVKAVIRHPLPSSSDEDLDSVASVSTRGGRQMSQQEKSSILARNLRALDAGDAEQLLTKIYTGISEVLRRLRTQIKTLLDITSGASTSSAVDLRKSPSKASNPAGFDRHPEVSHQPMNEERFYGSKGLNEVLDQSRFLGQAVDVAQAQIVKILKVRSEQTLHLPLGDFLRYFTLNRLFADECEVVSGDPGSPLKGVVNSHIAGYIQILSDTEKRRLAQTMESDKWEAVDFGDADNEMLTRVLNSMTKDPSDWIRSTRIWEQTNEGALPNANGILHPANGHGTAATAKVRSAIIDDEKYILVKSAIAGLQGIEHLEHLVAGIPSVTAEVATSIVEYLKLFNSKSSQLILGAGATRTASLKNITTKHLALSSQALSFMITLIPYVREFVRRHLHSASNSTLAEFDKVKRLYQEHQSGIHDKLVEIMSGRATTHVATMRKIDWDKDTGDESHAGATASMYMETLTKETSTLQRVLSKHLREPEVEMIVGAVFESYREQLGRAFEDAVVRSEAGKLRLLRDAESFRSRLSKLDGGGDIGTQIVNIVNDKSVDNPKPTVFIANSNGRPANEQDTPAR